MHEFKLLHRLIDEQDRTYHLYFTPLLNVAMDWDTAVMYAGESYRGHQWDLPTRAEIHAIVKTGIYQSHLPSSDGTYRESTLSSNYIWTKESSPDNVSAWRYTLEGNTYLSHKAAALNVCLVRRVYTEEVAQQLEVESVRICKMLDNGERLYQLHIHPDNDAKVMTWDEAIDYAVQCRDGGYDDWVLPNRQELLRLFELQECGDLPDDVVFFASNYWSSSAALASSAWRQNFNSGIQSQFTKTTSFYVRLVRRVYI